MQRGIQSVALNGRVWFEFLVYAVQSFESPQRNLVQRGWRWTNERLLIACQYTRNSTLRRVATFSTGKRDLEAYTGSWGLIYLGRDKLDQQIATSWASVAKGQRILKFNHHAINVEILKIEAIVPFVACPCLLTPTTRCTSNMRGSGNPLVSTVP